MFDEVCSGNILIWMILILIYDIVNGINLMIFLVFLFFSRAKNLSIDESSNENSLSEDNNSIQTKYTSHELNDKNGNLRLMFMTDELCKLYYMRFF